MAGAGASERVRDRALGGGDFGIGIGAFASALPSRTDRSS
jgi:hypothetical protein